MNDDEPFLSRWSRRKRGDAEPLRDAVVERAEPVAAPAAEEELDLSHLPPVEEIDALTDITQFLVRGVPAALQQAALRRAWAADPAIRDFIEVAENQWDFASGAIPGFGPLEPEVGFDAAGRAIASRLTPLSGELPEAADTPTPTRVRQGGAPSPDANVHDAESPADDDAVSQASDGQETEAPRAENSAPQNASKTADNGEMIPKSRHGGALPG